MLDSKMGQVKLEDIPVVKEFPNVFPEELLRLPSKREVDLSIEILPGMAPKTQHFLYTKFSSIDDHIQTKHICKLGLS